MIELSRKTPNNVIIIGDKALSVIELSRNTKIKIINSIQN